MEVGKRVEMLQRKSSIETEPRTLHLDQIENAREEALCVINTKTFQEAQRYSINSSIFWSFLCKLFLMELKNMQETQEGLRAGEEKRGRCLDLKDYDDEDERLIFLDPPGWDIASAPF
ncbi:unnamed protein product [Brassica rapa subsp. trilocularis]